MVRFIYLQKHLGTIPPSFFLTDIAALAWDRPRRGHLRQMTLRQTWRSAQAVPATTLGGRRRPLPPSTANENRIHKLTPWTTPLQSNKDFCNSEEHKPVPRNTPLRRDEEFLNVEGEFQGAATSEADPVALLMNQRSKSENYKPAPWHTPSRWGEELINLEDKVLGSVIAAADLAALRMDQRHIIHSPSMSECRLSIVHYSILKPPPTNSKMASWSQPRRGQIIKVKRAKIDKAKRSASSQLIRKSWLAR